MPIELPSPESSQKALEIADRSIAVAKDELAARTDLLAELTTLAEENAQLETRINEAKRMMYLLLYEKLQLAESTHAEEYASVIEAAVESLSPKEPGKK